MIEQHNGYDPLSNKELVAYRQQLVSDQLLSNDINSDYVEDIINISSHKIMNPDYNVNVSDITNKKLSSKQKTEFCGHMNKMLSYTENIDNIEDMIPEEVARKLLYYKSKEASEEKQKNNVPNFYSKKRGNKGSNEAKIQKDLETEANSVDPNEEIVQKAVLDHDFTDFSNTEFNNKLLDVIKFLSELELGIVPSIDELEEATRGFVRRTSKMKSYSDLNKIRKTELLNDDFFDRFIEKKCIKVDKFTEPKKKKTVLLTLDRSTSMLTPFKIIYVKSIFYYLLNNALDGNCVLYISTFERNCDGYLKIETLEDVKNFNLTEWWSVNGGGTNIERTIHTTFQDLSANKLPKEDLANKNDHRGDRNNYTTIDIENCHDPSLIIINDGQDRIDRNYKSPIPIHVLSLSCHNGNLENVAINSGGTYNHLHEDTDNFSDSSFMDEIEASIEDTGFDMEDIKEEGNYTDMHHNDQMADDDHELF